MTRLGGEIAGRGKGLSVLQSIQICSGVRPAAYSMRTRVVSLGVKRPGREFDHSHPSSAMVKNEWSYTSIPPAYL